MPDIGNIGDVPLHLAKESSGPFYAAVYTKTKTKNIIYNPINMNTNRIINTAIHTNFTLILIEDHQSTRSP